MPHSAPWETQQANTLDADFHHFPVCLAMLAECLSGFRKHCAHRSALETQTI